MMARGYAEVVPSWEVAEKREHAGAACVEGGTEL
jgi:hypothetical protein